MATITAVPPQVAAVGGTLNNPMEFTITTANTYESIVLQVDTGAGYTTLTTIRKRAISGSITVDVSRYLKTYLKGRLAYSDIAVESGDFQANNYDRFVRYRITLDAGATVSGERFACYAKLQQLDSSLVSSIVTNQEVSAFIDYGVNVLGETALTSGQVTALINLVNGLKANGTWDKKIAIYPFIGGTADWHSINLKNPGTYSLTYTASPTQASTGMTLNGTSQYATTNIPVSAISQNSFAFSVYSRVNQQETDGQVIGLDYLTAGHNVIRCNLRTSLDELTFNINSASGSSVANTDSSGLFTVSRTGSATTEGYIDGSSVVTDTDASTDPATLDINDILIGAELSAPLFVARYWAGEVAYVDFSTGLDDTEVSNDYTTIQAYQTALSRNV